MADIVIDPLVGGRITPSLDRSVLCGVSGEVLADVGLAPRLMAQSALVALRREADGVAPEFAVFTRAAHLFTTADLDGETFGEYLRRVTAVAGLPLPAVRRAADDLVEGITELPRTTEAELPSTDLGAGYRTRWVPSGRVFAAIMASNHPAPNVSWAQALFHGYSVLVRPGSRDPFTARRLVAALLRAGLPPAKLAFVPCAHTVGEFLLSRADRGIIYGGDQAVRTWRQNASVTTRGPGRTKALLDVRATDAILDHLATSAAFDGGTRCNNLSVVYTSESVSAVADQLAGRLAALSVVSAADTGAALPVFDRQRAQTLRRQISELRAELTDHSVARYGDDGFVTMDDGSVLVRPLVLSADRVDHPAVGTELPFPFLVVAPWSPADGVAALRESLVLNLLTDRDELVNQAICEPSIRKVTCGPVLPWAAVPGIPHDGNYTQFLLEPKGVVSATT